MLRPQVASTSQAERAAYEAAGCEVLHGRLGNRSVLVVFIPHAQRAMAERDVEPSEVIEILSRPLSAHERGQAPHRREVAAAIGSRRLRVVYERPTLSIVKVITVHQD